MPAAYAHEMIFPHLHPHPQMSIAEDLAFTLLFLALIYIIGRVSLAIFRKVTSDRT